MNHRTEQYYRRRRRAKIMGWTTGIVITIAIVFAIAIIPISLINSRETVTIHVQDKERGSGSGEHKTATLVFTDNETYKVEDSILAWEFNSADVYRQLLRGKTYTCDVQGWRVHFMSTYKTILRCDGFK